MVHLGKIPFIEVQDRTSPGFEQAFKMLGGSILLYNKCILFHILHFLCYIMGTVLVSKEAMNNNTEHLVYKTQTCSTD